MILAPLLYALLTTAAYSLLTQARITEWLWSRYPDGFAEFMNCPSCSGFWYGIGCGALGWWMDWPFLVAEPDHWLTPVLVGLCSYVWTPILACTYTDAYARMVAAGDASDADGEPPDGSDRAGGNGVVPFRSQE